MARPANAHWLNTLENEKDLNVVGYREDLIRFGVDSGAAVTVIPVNVANQFQIEKGKGHRFVAADGSVLELFDSSS